MKTQLQPAKKLKLNKQSIRVLNTNGQISSAKGPTGLGCSITNCG